MDGIFSRNEVIWGKDAQEKLKTKNIAVFGIGGVGGFALEALARAGIENFTIVDFDIISKSNINRQIIALHSTIGKSKTDIFEKRLIDINPNIKIRTVNNFYNNRLDTNIFNEEFDYVVDAIDTLRSKIELLVYCHKNNIPVITSMGAGNRLDPTKLYICDISEIENKKDTFIKNVLYQLNQRGIESGIKAIVSREKPHALSKISNTEKIITEDGEYFEFQKISPGSTPFVPAVAGYYMAYSLIETFLK